MSNGGSNSPALVINEKTGVFTLYIGTNQEFSYTVDIVVLSKESSVEDWDCESSLVSCLTISDVTINVDRSEYILLTELNNEQEEKNDDEIQT